MEYQLLSNAVVCLILSVKNAVVCGTKSASRNPQKTGIYQM